MLVSARKTRGWVQTLAWVCMVGLVVACGRQKKPTLPPIGRTPPAATRTATTAPSATPKPSPLPPTPTPSGSSTPKPTATALVPASAPQVHVPAGEFLMGSTAADIERWEQAWLDNVLHMQVHTPEGYGGQFMDEWPQLSVYLEAFSIDQVEVSNARYQLCVQAGACDPPAYTSDRYADPAYTAHPVVGISPAQAGAFCRWVGGRLPSEAEWEKAARGTDGRIYPWDDAWDGTRLGLGPETAPVGSYLAGASPYGALDMVGNVAEWVSDPYAAYPGGRLYAPTGEMIPGGGYTYRGGLFYLDADFRPELAYRTATRAGVDDNIFPFVSQRIGFRCVQGAEPAPLSAVVVGSSAPVLLPTPTRVDLGAMIEIPAGEFLMGSDLELGDDRGAHVPAHTVYLDAFYIDRYQVTNAQYVAFLNVLGQNYLACDGRECTSLQTEEMLLKYTHPSRILEVEGRYVAQAGYENHPVNLVTWQGAQAYCHWLGKRLPTEAEWEKAARGTAGRLFPWGDHWEPEKIGYGEPLAPVGSYPDDVSPYGVMGMLGGVREWMADWYDPDYYYQSPARNPSGPGQPGEYRERVARPYRVDIGLVSRGGGIREGFRCAYGP
jgi:formylglycine-generating enzyme required for sulfatase activity